MVVSEAGGRGDCHAVSGMRANPWWAVAGTTVETCPRRRVALGDHAERSSQPVAYEAECYLLAAAW